MQLLNYDYYYILILENLSRWTKYLLAVSFLSKFRENKPIRFAQTSAGKYIFRSEPRRKSWVQVSLDRKKIPLNIRITLNVSMRDGIQYETNLVGNEFFEVPLENLYDTSLYCS